MRWVGLLDGLGHLLVAIPAHGAGEEDEELVVLERFDDFGPLDVVRWGVEEAGAFEHAGGIGEPDGVPVGLDLAGGGPAGTGSTVELLKGRRVQEECF